MNFLQFLVGDVYKFVLLALKGILHILLNVFEFYLNAPSRYGVITLIHLKSSLRIFGSKLNINLVLSRYHPNSH